MVRAMNSFVDDPRLTAYALGEVDEAERAEVESLLKRSPDARRWVESVQQTSARLSAALKEELLVTGYELRTGNGECRISNGELHIDRGAIEVGDFEADSVNGQSRAIRAPSASAGLEQTTDSQTNRSLALPALKGRRVLRLIPFALAASVAVASGVTYVAWRQIQNEKVARLNSNINLHQIGHGLSQYRYDDSPAIPTVALSDLPQSKQGDAVTAIRNGSAQVSIVLVDPNADGPPEILNGTPLVFGEAVTEDFDPIEPIVYEPETDAIVIESPLRVVDQTAHDIVGIELTNLVSNVDLDGSAADAAVPIDTDADGQSDSSTTHAFAFAMAAPTRNALAARNPNGPDPWYEQLRYPADWPTSPLVYGAVETKNHDAGDTGAVSPEAFALAVDSLDGINDSGGLSGARFTSGGYDAIDQDALGRGVRAADSSPQIGLKAKPNMDLRYTRNELYQQQRSALVEQVPAPGNGQSIFGGSGGGEEEFPNHATYDIKVPKGQYSSVTARDQASTIRSISDVEAMQAGANGTPPQDGNSLPYDQSRARVSTSNFDEGAPIRAPQDRDNSADDAGTNVTSGYGSKHERDLQYIREYQTPRDVTRSISQSDLVFQDVGTAATTLNATSSSGGDVADDYVPVSSKIAMEVNVGGGNLNVSEMDLAYQPGGLGCYPDLPTNQASQVPAESKGDPFFGGNWLTGGNVDGAHVVSSEDYGVLVTTWSRVAATASRDTTGFYYFAGGRTFDADMPGSFAGSIPPQYLDADGNFDFTKNDNISYGYQVPFGPPGALPSTSKSGAMFYVFNPANAGEVEAGVPGLSKIEQVRGLYRNDPTTAESYDPVIEIPFLFVENQPLSTFSIDVDTASYTNVRRMLNQNVLPPHGAVRVEEMINYFDYDYPPPTGADPFSVNVAVAECPWNPEHRLARIGIKGKVFTDRNRPAANLVFLVDVSGSMQDANKLPLVRHGLRAMVEQLTPRDSVAIVTYADGTNVALPATSARNKQTILDAVDRLMSGGGTNGGAGIETAYQLANEHYVEGGANRVILATDGDFNVGVTRQDELVSMIEEKAATGVFLSVLGFGMGNIKDSMLEKLADKGNGLYAYIDDDVEVERVLVDQMGGTLVTIAKDVKIQVEFNPAEVGAYRLIGYENRMLRAQDFNNDAKDAGEIGAGHTVTALYEIVPAGMQAHEPGVDPLKYQGGDSRVAARDEVPGDDTEMVEVDDYESAEEVEDADSVVDAETEASEPRPQGSGQRIVQAREVDTADGGSADPPYNGELMTVKLRYKDPEGDVSKLIELPVTDEGLTIDDASDDFVFAASVASFGMMLRGSAHTPDLSFDSVLEMAKSAMGEDPFGYREEFIQLVEKAKTLSTQKQ